MEPNIMTGEIILYNVRAYKHDVPQSELHPEC